MQAVDTFHTDLTVCVKKTVLDYSSRLALVIGMCSILPSLSS